MSDSDSGAHIHQRRDTYPQSHTTHSHAPIQFQNEKIKIPKNKTRMSLYM